MAEPGRSRWEPAARLPLRWGEYRTRMLGGLLLIAGGGMAVAGSSGFVSWLLAAGTVVHAAGWAVLPAAGWRRIVAAGPSTLSMWLLLAGPRFVGVLVLAYLAWLLVRHRPLGSYTTVVFVIAGAIIIGRLFPEYRDMPIALTLEVAVMAGSAAAARIIHRAVAHPRAVHRARSRSSTANQQR